MLRSPAPGQNPKSDLSGLTTGNYKALPRSSQGENLPFLHQSRCTVSALQLSGGSYSQGLRPTWYSHAHTHICILAQVPPFRGYLFRSLKWGPSQVPPVSHRYWGGLELSTFSHSDLVLLLLPYLPPPWPQQPTSIGRAPQQWEGHPCLPWLSSNPIQCHSVGKNETLGSRYLFLCSLAYSVSINE